MTRDLLPYLLGLADYREEIAAGLLAAPSMHVTELQDLVVGKKPLHNSGATGPKSSLELPGRIS
jgi:hypothetical protein